MKVFDERGIHIMTVGNWLLKDVFPLRVGIWDGMFEKYTIRKPISIHPYGCDIWFLLKAGYYLKD